MQNLRPGLGATLVLSVRDSSIASAQATPADSALAGADYHRQINAGQRPVRVRARFHALIEAMLAPAMEVLDFGAGTGIDARFLTAQGHRVHIFEPEPAMLAYLRRHCAAEIEAGRISILYRVADVAPVDAIIANFAVFNLVEDLGEMFRQFHAALKPEGFVIAAVLNPWAARDMGKRWWWRTLPRLVLRGSYALPTASGPLRRATAHAFAREAAPWFRCNSLTAAGLLALRHPYLFLRFDRRKG